MQYVYHLITLVIWTLICVALVYGLELVFERFGYRTAPMDAGPDHVPPLPPET